MKIIITTITFLITLLSFSQSETKKELVLKPDVKIEAVSIKITVDSLEDIQKETFNKDDIKSLFISNQNEAISLEIVCNGSNNPEGFKSSLSLKVDGNSNDIDSFITSFQKIKTMAINFYKNKN